jgi:Sigma-70 factor, region 1.1
LENRIGKSYTARKALFAKGLREGRLTVQEIEAALPPGTLTAAERWLLYYSLRAAQVEIVDEITGEVDHGFHVEEPTVTEH